MIKFFFILVGIFGLQFLFSSPALSAFSITGVSPTTINSSGDVITIDATASGLQNSTQFVEVGFTKEGETSANYFGLTKNLSDEFYQYKSSPTIDDRNSYFYKFTPVSGVWSGQITAKIDLDDSGFKGPGNYLVRLSKFITSSTASTTNTMTISVTFDRSPSPVPSPSPSPFQTPIPTPVASPKPSTTPSPIILPTPTLADNGDEGTGEGMILGINTATNEATVEASYESIQSGVQQPGIFGMSPLFLGLTGGGVVFLSISGYLFYRGSRFGRIDTNVQDS